MVWIYYYIGVKRERRQDMKYTVIELTMDGSFFSTKVHGLTKEEAENAAKKMTIEDQNGSEYVVEEEH